MKVSLGGTLFVYNAESQDYSWREAIACIKALCDEVVLLDAGSTDGTADMLLQYTDEKTMVVTLPTSEWERMRGKEKLAHFTNLAKDMLSTDWHFNIQADECLHENSFPFIREAIEKNEEGFFCERVNLWGDSQHKLNVPHERTPVGTQIIRLAKTKYYSVGDGEGIFTGNASWDYYDRIRLYHTGFIRDKHIHVKKIEHMLTQVFGMGMDEKVTAMKDGFNPWINFTRNDVVPISESLPLFIKEWAAQRDEINK